MTLKWMKDKESIFNEYRAEYDGYRFHIVATNPRCVVLGVGPDMFGPFGSLKIAKAFAGTVVEALQQESE